MTLELLIWLLVSLGGVAGLPFFGHRRYVEWKYCQMEGAPLKWLLFKSRLSRLIFLSAGVTLAALVAVVVVLPIPDNMTRTITIVMLIGVEACMVATLWSDEFWAKRIDSYRPEREEAG